MGTHTNGTKLSLLSVVKSVLIDALNEIIGHEKCYLISSGFSLGDVAPKTPISEPKVR